MCFSLFYSSRNGSYKCKLMESEVSIYWLLTFLISKMIEMCGSMVPTKLQHFFNMTEFPFHDHLVHKTCLPEHDIT